MPKTIEGWVDSYSHAADDPKRSWVVNFKLVHDGGEDLWMGVAITGPNQQFAQKIMKEVDELPKSERSHWEIGYEENPKYDSVNKITHQNAMVKSAKMISAPPAPAPAPAPAAQQATSKDDSIARAVAYKGAIDLVAKSDPIAEYIKRKSRGSVWESILLTANCTSALMNAGELMLQHEYSPEKMMLIIQKYSQGSGDDAQLEIVDAGQDTLFDTDNPI